MLFIFKLYREIRLRKADRIRIIFKFTRIFKLCCKCLTLTTFFYCLLYIQLKNVNPQKKFLKYYNQKYNIINCVKFIKKMSESQRRSTQQLFSQAKAIHLQTRTNSLELQNKLSFIQTKIQDHSSFLNCGFCTRSQSGIDDTFKRAFKKLNLAQQVHLFWRMCNLVKQIKQKKVSQQEMTQKYKNRNPQKQMLDTTVYVKDKKQYKVWTVTRIKASLRTKKVVITDKSIVLDMHDYLIRSAKKKQRQCFALQATNPQQAYQTIKFSNQGHSYDQTVGFFKKLKKKALQDQIRVLIDPSSKTIQNEQKQIQVKIPKLQQKKSIKTDNKPRTNSTSVISPSYQKMMTLKIVNPQYGNNTMKLIQKQMLERQHVIRLRDNSYSQIYKGLVGQKVLSNLDNLRDFQKIRETQFSTVYYNRKDQKVKKLYRFKATDITVFDWMMDELNNFSNFKKWKTNLESISCLKIFPSEKTKVFHQVYRHSNKKINYVYIRHHFDIPNPTGNSLRLRKNYFFYDQSVVIPITKSYFCIPQPLAQISYIIWKFSQVNDQMILTIQGRCDHFTTPQNNLKMTDDFLGQIQKLKSIASNYYEENLDSQIMLNTVLFQQQYLQKISEFQQLDHDTEFYTISDNVRQQKNNSLINKENSTNIKPNFTKALCNLNKQLSMQEDFDVHNQQSLLKFRHPVFPYKKRKPKLIVPKKDHFHWETQWVINNKGELININKQKLQAQNNVLKSVFKRLGKNILSGKSILSISLPVDVFGDQSNLSRLCNSYGYAPIFLQQAAQYSDSLERFKRCISFAISATVIYIKMDKPFNPILGETYNSLIDGSPVYGQQISHHPPISAVFMKGRGYTLYGNLQAKVELSLNSASGINDGQICMSFNQNQQYTKNLVKYTAPAGQVAGLIFGQRTMSIVKTSHFFDEDNLLYCQMFWGKTKKKSQYSNKFYDAIQGHIVKLKPNFDKRKWKSVKKQDVYKQMGMIHGRWTGAVFFDNQPLFDTYKTHPYQIEPYQASFQSDSTKRKDLILRKNAVDMEPAQLAKQQLQEIQRRDRKLRASYLKNK